MFPAYQHCFSDCIDDIFCLQCRCKFPGNDPAGEQIHDTGQIYKSLPRRNICNVCAPYGIWLLRRKVPVQNIPEPVREILAVSGECIRLDPTGPDAHFLHIPCNCSLRSAKATLMKLFCDLRRSIYAETLIIYLSDSFHDFLLQDTSAAGFPSGPVIVTTFRNT